MVAMKFIILGYCESISFAFQKINPFQYYVCKLFLKKKKRKKKVFYVTLIF